MRLRAGVHVSICRRGGGRRSAAGAICALAAGLLAGCTTSDEVGTYLVDPAHYTFYHCKDLEKRLTSLLAREQQLHELMDKANEGGGGALIGTLSYRAEYENARGEEAVLRHTAADKNCQLPPPTSAASAAPSPAVAVAAPLPAPPAPPVSAAPTSYQSDQTIR